MNKYYVTDSHGNVIQLTDESGAITKIYEYDSFGNEENPDSKDENPFRYCGEYYDKETEEIYLRARYYQPSVGRFLTRDSYTGEEDEPESLHLYTYCENDGMNMVDSNGHWGKELTKGKRKKIGVTDSAPRYGRVYKNITDQAMENLDKKLAIKITKTMFKKLIQGSVYPDEHKKDGKEILGIKIGPETKFHGKVKKKLNNLKKVVLKRVKQKKGKKAKKYLLIGTVLHSIQDYQAHSYYSDVQPIRERAENNNGRKIKIKSEAKRKYHQDWIGKTKKKKNNKIVYIYDKDFHNNFKDNVYYDFRKKEGKYKWVQVKKREENQRYLKALNQSKKYIKKALKKVK